MASQCRSCHQEIRWVTTEAGKPMSIDPKPTEDGTIIPVKVEGKVVAHTLRKGEEVPPGVKRFTSHWVTCPTADQHRRQRKTDG